MSDDAKVPLPVPVDYLYVWDCGNHVRHSVSPAPYNGRNPDDGHPVFTAEQLRAYGDARERAARAAEREACARICDKYALDSGVARAIRARAEGQR